MGKMKPVVRAIKDALDSAATHARRTSDLPRKHRSNVDNDINRRETTDTDLGRPTTPGSKPSGNPPIDPDRNPDWLNERLADADLPFWRRRMAEGDQFNYQNHHRYPENEVRTADGKYLDSYREGREIVSRKNTQLDNVKPETAMRYLDEVNAKYGPGTQLADGRTLRGEPILEIPVQNGPVPQSVIDHANGMDPPVTIRDVRGNIYN